MALSRRGLGVILFAAGVTLFSLVILSATSSGVQAAGVKRPSGGASATAGGNGDNCPPGTQNATTNQYGTTQPTQNGATNPSNPTTGTTQPALGGPTNASGNSSNSRKLTKANRSPNANNNTNPTNPTNPGTPTGNQPDSPDNQGNGTLQYSNNNGASGGDPSSGVLAGTFPCEPLPSTGVSAKKHPAAKAATNKGRSSDHSKKKPKQHNQSHKNNRSGEQTTQPKLDNISKPDTSSKLDTSSKSVFRQTQIPSWPVPTSQELASVDSPRQFAPDPGAKMTLTIDSLGLYDAPVQNSNRAKDLDNGLLHLRKTSLPWDDSAQRNVYIAGHYLGYPDSASRLIFYNLNKLNSGDNVVLKDSQGKSYEYQVSEKFVADPNDSWAMGQVANRDMVTLQTCIPPDFGKRLIVRADRVH